jgi:hypothetical protein
MVRTSDGNRRRYICDQVGTEGLKSGREIAALIGLPAVRTKSTFSRDIARAVSRERPTQNGW